MCELLPFSFADTLLTWMCVQVERSVLEEVSSGGKHARHRAGACESRGRITRRRKKQNANLKDEVG